MGGEKGGRMRLVLSAAPARRLTGASTMKQRTGRILIVDDDREMRRVLAEFLEGEGFEVIQAADATQTLERIREAPCDVLILDKNLPDWSGVDILPTIRKLIPGTPVIVITAFGDARTHDEAFTRGAYDLLLKPFSLDDLLEALRRAYDHANGEQPRRDSIRPEGLRG
jgi:DNA-binding NtrC family response regulator